MDAADETAAAGDEAPDNELTEPPALSRQKTWPPVAAFVVVAAPPWGELRSRWLRAVDERGAADRAAMCLLLLADRGRVTAAAGTGATPAAAPADDGDAPGTEEATDAAVASDDSDPTARASSAAQRCSSPHRHASNAVAKVGIAERVRGSMASANSSHWLSVGTTVGAEAGDDDDVSLPSASSSSSSSGKNDCTRPWRGSNDSVAKVVRASIGKGASSTIPVPK